MSYRAAVLPIAFALLAAPLVAHAQSATPAREYDMNAEALLQKASDRLKAAPSFSSRVVVISTIPASGQTPAKEQRMVRTLRLQKPNRIYQEVETQTKGVNGTWASSPSTRYVSDGKTGAQFFLKDKTYRKLGVAPANVTDYGMGFGFGDFFDSKLSDAQYTRDAKARGELVSLKMASDATFAGVSCSVVEEVFVVEKIRKSTTKIYVGKKDGIFRGYRLETPSPNGDGAVQQTDYLATNVVVGDTIPARLFAVDLTGYTERMEPKLLTAGTMAPDFIAYDKDNKAVKLSDFKGKIVILDFWATWCVPCLASLPHTTEVAKKMADKGVVVLAVNVWDTKGAWDKWLPAHPEFSLLTFAIDTKEQPEDVATKQYHVSLIPTQYVIDRNGKIVASFLGYDKPNSDLEKAIAKADLPTAPPIGTPSTTPK